MIPAIATLLVFQLFGEVLVRAAGLAFPGPVVGLVGLLCLLSLRPALAERLAAPANVLLANLSLLFVPAGVGIVGQFDVFGTEGVALVAAIATSTLVAILVSFGSFTLVARMVGAGDD